MGQQNGKEGDSSGGRFSISFSISMVLLGATHVFDDVGDYVIIFEPPKKKEPHYYSTLAFSALPSALFSALSSALPSAKN